MEKIDLVDLRKETEIYKRENVVEIYTARLIRRPSEILCVKKLYVSSTMEANDKYSECLAMLALNHPNIIKMKSCIISGSARSIDSVSIVMEYFPLGDLERLIQKNRSTGGFRAETVMKYAEQLIGALAYMQTNKVSNKDLKPQNIFVFDENTVKIGDLGSATRVDRDVMTITGIPLYLSPTLEKLMESIW